MDANTTQAVTTTEQLPDIICRVMAWWITSSLDDGASLTAGVMEIPQTEYRRERLTTWIREMGRPAAIDALRAYAKSPAEIAALEAEPTPAAQAAEWAAACEALDAASPAVRLAALQATVEATVNDLERAGLVPADYEYVPDTNVGEFRILTGNLQLRATMTGTLDTPAAHFIVITSDDDDPGVAMERTTTDLGAVRAWIMSWTVAALTRSAAA